MLIFFVYECHNLAVNYHLPVSSEVDAVMLGNGLVFPVALPIAEIVLQAAEAIRIPGVGSLDSLDYPNLGPIQAKSWPNPGSILVQSRPNPSAILAIPCPNYGPIPPK